MFIIRDIFQLTFGHFKDAKALIDEARNNKIFPEAQHMRILSDFTGDSYRLILEQGYETLAEYEKALSGELTGNDWGQWYNRFKTHVNSSYREILKVL